MSAKKKPERPPKPVLAWAWAVKENGRWVLWPFSDRTCKDLAFSGRPSGEARAVRVRLVPAERRKKP